MTNQFRFLSCGRPIYIRKKPYAKHDDNGNGNGNDNVAKQKFKEQKESQYISWSPFTNQQLEMSNFHICRCCVFFVSFFVLFSRTWTTTVACFMYFFLELNAFVANSEDTE